MMHCIHIMHCIHVMHREFFTYIGVEMASGDSETTSKKTITYIRSCPTSKASSKELG